MIAELFFLSILDWLIGKRLSWRIEPRAEDRCEHTTCGFVAERMNARHAKRELIASYEEAFG